MPPTAAAPRPAIQSHDMPAMKNSAPQAIDDQHRLAEVGLGDEQRRDDGEQDQGEDVAGNVGARAASRQTARRR